MEKFYGTWRLESSEKFDDYMKAIGVGFVLRKLGNTIKPDVQFMSIGDGVYCCKTISTFKNTVVEFQLDQEFNETTIDGRKVQSVISLGEDGVFVHKQSGTPESVIKRWLQSDDTMVVTCEAADATCRRIYKKVTA